MEVRDLVCGMWIEQERAAASAKHRGKTHYFCSTGCRRSFVEDPDSFLVEVRTRSHEDTEDWKDEDAGHDYNWEEEE